MLHFTLQRQALLRHDESQLQQLRNSKDARVLGIFDDKLPMLAGELFRPLQEFSSRQRAEAFFLGLYEGLPTFALALDEANAGGYRDADFDDLRPRAGYLTAEHLAIACEAKALVHWHVHHRFCAGCGAPTEVREAGHSRHCPSCQRNHFPRTDPAIIVGVTHADKLLFGRGANWPAGRFGMIAGFVEPGESMEQAVAREVMEETGILIRNVQYVMSQPWPSPMSLMLAFFAETDDPQLTLHDKELEEARWLSRDELVTAVRNGSMKLPTRASVAYGLTKVWFEQRGDSLADALPK
ncbi:NAD(+) diphosphatase [Permianibacter sp. IMCC34836]|uniref:NAD(+) diphosphatase n=1 Tax=Permianibacter fluminis TaxID=2738515 RepID=UPI0015562485|nr:NAD(+) diphosphatase [Permianibacter fluminis]NQD37114.1 NAD(+) diphosphatase [Permianibacter fluminis]